MKGIELFEHSPTTFASDISPEVGRRRVEVLDTNGHAVVGPIVGRANRGPFMSEAWLWQSAEGWRQDQPGPSAFVY